MTEYGSAILVNVADCFVQVTIM